MSRGHLLLDATPLLERKFGIGHYVEHLARALAARPGGPPPTGLFRYVRASGKAFPDWMPRRSLRLPHPATDLLFGTLGLPADRLLDTDIFHATTLFLPRLARTPSVLTVYDLAFKVNPEWFPWPAADFDARLRRALSRATHVVTISESTRQDLLKHYDIAPDRVTAVLLGPSHDAPPVSAPPPDPAIPEPYILYAGTIEPRKNVARLVEAWSRTKTESALVLAGADGWKFADVDEAIARSPRRDRILRLGYVPADRLVRLYARARAFAYPSLYEGFGLPVLEAMRAGIPVLTCPRSSIPEIGGDAVIYAEPESIEEIATELERLDADTALRNRLATAGRERARTFSWERTAQETAEVYAAALKDFSK